MKEDKWIERDGTGGSAGCEGYEKTGGTRKKLIEDHRRHSFHSYVFYTRAGVNARSCITPLQRQGAASILPRPNDGDGESVHRSCAGVRLRAVHARAIPRER